MDAYAHGTRHFIPTILTQEKTAENETTVNYNIFVIVWDHKSMNAAVNISRRGEDKGSVIQSSRVVLLG